MIEFHCRQASVKAGFVCGFLEDDGLSGKGGGWRRATADDILQPWKGRTMNKRVMIDMPEEILRLVEEYAAQKGAAPDAYMLDVIEQHLEDLHDIALADAAMERIRNGERTYTWEEMERELGLED
jgi:RHH-type rel operon transcriptional repressor/antitoxin RelB